MFDSVLQAAFELNSEAIENSRIKDFQLAFSKWNDAERAYDNIATQNTLTDQQHISLQLARANTSMARGVGERHRCRKTAAAIAINAANDTIDSLRSKVVDAAGDADWHATKSGLNWHAAKGRILTNIGALEFESRNYDTAFSTWLLAEQHLFGHRVLPLRTDAKPRHVMRHGGEFVFFWRAYSDWVSRSPAITLNTSIPA